MQLKRNLNTIKPAFMWVKISEKKHPFFGLRSPYHEQANRKQLVLPFETYSKTLKDMIIGTGGT